MNSIRPTALAMAGLLAMALALPALVPVPVTAQTTLTESPRPRPAPNRAPPAAPSDATTDAAEAPAATGAVAAPAAPAPPPRDPNRGAVTNLPLPRFVSLKGNEGNARRGPGRTHRIDWVFTRAGMPLLVTAEFENWRRVEDAEGAGGWVHYSLLSGTRAVLVTQVMASFYSLPDDRSAVVFQAEKGVIARVLQCDADWCRVLAEGQRGWTQKTALWGVAAGEIID